MAQIAPVWLDRVATLTKVLDCIERAAAQGADLIAFGEAFAPGYPFWIERTNGSQFNSSKQKKLHAFYAQQAVQIEAGHLDAVCAASKEHSIAVYLGIIERPTQRGGHSLYCSMVYINAEGDIGSVHRKLMPTYEERLSWSPGDGHGLQTHRLGAFTVGGLNCWENWMPLARSALYAQGEDLHVAIWPGGEHNTIDITRFIAKESRSYVMSVSGLLKVSDIPESVPFYDDIVAACDGEYLANGGSCVAAPDGEWVVEPQIEKEDLIIAHIDHARVYEERQNFDPAGHYSRPDVTQLVVNRQRQSTLVLKD
nr:carbon-nitrogen hydrolase family protein [Pleionea sp. CnH1-48]